MFSNRKKRNSTEAKTAQALQMPMLYKQQQRVSVANDGVMQNPAFQYQNPPTVDQPKITKLNGNTEVANNNAIQRLNDDYRSTSTDNLLKS